MSAGQYTPKISHTINVASSKVYPCQWFRVGNNVTVYGMVQITVPFGGNMNPTQWTMNLPVASTLNTLAGTGTSGGNGVALVSVTPDMPNSSAMFQAQGTSAVQFPTGGQTALVSFNFSYLV